MLLSRQLAASMIAEVMKPRGGLVKFKGGKAWLLDRQHNVFRPVVLKNKVLHTLDEQEENEG